LSDPAHYVTSDYYQPGLMSNVGVFAFAVVLIIAIFIGVVLGSRLALRRSKRLNPGVRKVLKLVSGLAKPAAPLSFSRGRQSKLGRRSKSEDHYKLRPSAAEPVQPASRRSVQLAARVQEVTDQPIRRKRISQDFAPLPEESWPSYAEDEVQAVADVLRSGKVNQWTGSKVFEFEQVYTRLLRNGRAIALANGSVALELALRAFRIGPGDEVVVTPRRHRQYQRGHDRRRDHAAHQGSHPRPSRRLAGRYARHHGPGPRAWHSRDRGLRPGPRRGD
jgi:hypothetical protein